MRNSKWIGIALLAGFVACGGAQNKGTGDGTGTGGGTGDGNTQALPQFPDEDFRKTQPEPSAPRPFQLPGINTFQLAKDVTVFLVERHALPTISVSLTLQGGSVTDPKGKEGLASVCMSMISEGTDKLEKMKYNEALADIGSSISSYAGDDQQGLAMSSLTKEFGATRDLFVETIVDPGFRQADLDRMIKRRINNLNQAKATPASIAGRLFGNISFGPTHPRGRIETEKSLGKIKIADCKRYHKTYVKPSGARLFVVGDMTEAQVKEAFAPLLSTWKGRPKKIAKQPKRKPRKGKMFFVNVPGAAQSSIYAIHAGPLRTDDGYFANTIMVSVLGGGFSSRINMNLREDKGYSYGARGAFSYSRDFGTFYAGSSVRSDATLASIQEILTEIGDIKAGTRPATEEEIAREKKGAILGLPARFATASQSLGVYRDLAYYGLPMDYYNTYVDNVGKVTPEEINAAAAKHLRPDDIQLLIVGDGSAAQNSRDDSGKDVPLMNGDKPVTLLDALNKSVAEMGGKLVLLDADGKKLAK